jgi:ABC-2 type transport system ATP-binding protein
MIDTCDLGKIYTPVFRGLFGPRSREVNALRKVTLRVERGEVFGLMGPNGAGKTTLLRLLATLVPPSAGHARVAGADLVREAARVRRVVGFASGEERGFYWRLSGLHNLEFFAGVLGMSPAAARSRAAEALERMDLLPMAGQPAGEYSTGMRQRLGIARALLGRPAVLLLDEPTRSLDPVAASGLHTLIARLAADSRTTVLLATHNFDEAARVCDRVAVLVAGAVREIVPGAAAGRDVAARYRAALVPS